MIRRRCKLEILQQFREELLGSVERQFRHAISICQDSRLPVESDDLDQFFAPLDEHWAPRLDADRWKQTAKHGSVYNQPSLLLRADRRHSPPAIRTTLELPKPCHTLENAGESSRLYHL
ncbi:MAG: hypothetical protein ABIP48_11290 [Planctomycetota bacterium]